MDQALLGVGLGGPDFGSGIGTKFSMFVRISVRPTGILAQNLSGLGIRHMCEMPGVLRSLEADKLQPGLDEEDVFTPGTSAPFPPSGKVLRISGGRIRMRSISGVSGITA